MKGWLRDRVAAGLLVRRPVSVGVRQVCKVFLGRFVSLSGLPGLSLEQDRPCQVCH
jgi:hypothetical protein